MKYDGGDEEEKKVGISIEEGDGLLWVGVRQGASPPTHLDYPSSTNQNTASGLTPCMQILITHRTTSDRHSVPHFSFPSPFLHALMSLEECIILLS